MKLRLVDMIETTIHSPIISSSHNVNPSTTHNRRTKVDTRDKGSRYNESGSLEKL